MCCVSCLEFSFSYLEEFVELLIHYFINDMINNIGTLIHNQRLLN